MNYTHLLLAHSYYRWMVLLAIVIYFLWLFRQHKQGTVFLKKHYYIVIAFTLLVNIQFFLGLLLYLTSPVVQHFWSDFATGVKNRQLRFFGMEHVTMMTIGCLCINYYTLKIRNRIGQSLVFTYLWKRYCWILLIILSSIPWAGSPLTSRPNWR